VSEGARFIRFNAVGTLNLAMKLGLLAALREWAGLGYMLSTAMSVEVAILHGFFWHHVWTWGERRLSARLPALLVRALRYNIVVGVLAFTVNLGMMHVLVEGFSVHYLLAGAVATACSGLLNFLISDSFIFVQAPPLPARS